MSIVTSSTSGVKPGSSPVRTDDFEEGSCPLSCACPACQSELDWIAMERRALEALEQAAPVPFDDLEDWADCFSPEYWERELGDDDEAEAEAEVSLDETDYAWSAGFTLGYHLMPAGPPRDYSDLEVVAWFGGYHAGRAKGIADLLDELDERDETLRLRPDPEDDWHESEIASARSNGGHPAGEGGR